MTREEFCSNFNITKDQFFGRTPIGGNLNLSLLTSIPEDFNPTVIGDLGLGSLKTIPEGFNPTVAETLNLHSVESIPKDFNPIVGGSLYLDSLTSITDGFSPIVGGNLNLSSLETIPEGFNLTVGGFLWFASVKSIQNGFNPIVGEDLYLRSLTAIPEGFNPTVGEGLYLNPFASIPEAFNPEKYLKPLPLIEWPSGYLKCDGIFSKIQRKIGNVYVLTDIGSTEEYYLVTDGGGNYAHGDTIESAKADLTYKKSEQNVETYKGLNLDEPIDFQECITMYRSITGSCSLGVKDFVETNGIKSKSHTVREIIKLTEGSYGHEMFKRFFE